METKTYDKWLISKAKEYAEKKGLIWPEECFYETDVGWYFRHELTRHGGLFEHILEAAEEDGIKLSVHNREGWQHVPPGAKWEVYLPLNEDQEHNIFILGWIAAGNTFEKAYRKPTQT